MSQNNQNRKDEQIKSNAISPQVQTTGVKKKTGKQSSSAKKTKKELAKRKKIIWSIVSVAVLISIIFLGPYLTQGSRFNLGTSANPIGFYRMELNNRYGMVVNDLDFDLIIIEDGILNGTLSIVDGTFSTTQSNQSEIYYAKNQSYTCIAKAGWVPAVVPIECDEARSKAPINEIELRPLGENSYIKTDVQIRQTINTSSYAPFGNTYSISNNQSYRVFIDIRNNAVGPQNAFIGSQVVIPDYILSTSPLFAKTWAINQTNYAAHCFMIDSHVNFTYTSDGKFLDIVYFDYEAKNYTMVTLPAVANDGPVIVELEFTALSTNTIKYCLWDGTLDAPFDNSYMYYKYGGF